VLLVRSEDADAVAKAVAAYRRGRVVEGDVAGVGIATAPSWCVAVHDDDDALALSLSASLATVVVAFDVDDGGPGRLAVFDGGRRRRSIEVDEDGTELEGEPFAFEDDLLDLDEDDDEPHVSLDLDLVEDYAARLGLHYRVVPEPGGPVATVRYTVVRDP
jgi:hypothetical protein